jgi:UDPglucose 6-dehydrogenase
VDSVIDGLSLATQRLISPKYLRGGMGDGGGCHPRDNIAMSWLARELDLSYDFFNVLMQGREDQTTWLADLMMETVEVTGLPPFMLGEAFKGETNLTVGSPSILLQTILDDKYHNELDEVSVPIHDPHTNDVEMPTDPCVFFIGTMHPEFQDYSYPKGSIIIDPWRYIPDMDGVTVHRLGEFKESERE